MYNPLSPSEKGPHRSERSEAAGYLYAELMEGFRGLHVVAGPTVAALDAAESRQAAEAQVQAASKNPLFEETVAETVQETTSQPASELTVDSARAALEEIWQEAA